jgi:DNA-binding NarL/FixJ family response regulator
MHESKYMSVKILIVDKHLIVCKQLQTYLALDGQITVVGTAANRHEALELLRFVQKREESEGLPDVAIIDAELHSLHGSLESMAILTAFHLEFPAIKIIINSFWLQPNSAFYLYASRLGVQHFITKDSDLLPLVKALKC